MTPKQVQDKLNRLCPGLGDAAVYNHEKHCINNKESYNKVYKIKSLSSTLWAFFSWSKSIEGIVFWSEIVDMITEMEEAELI